MPEAMTHVDFGTATRSSALETPQTYFTFPSGSQSSARRLPPANAQMQIDRTSSKYRFTSASLTRRERATKRREETSVDDGTETLTISRRLSEASIWLEG